MVDFVEWLWPHEDMTHWPLKQRYGRMLDNYCMGCGEPEEWPAACPGCGEPKELK
jgi:rubrerythrin